MTKKTDFSNTEKAFTDLRKIIIRLTAPDGCPWDREQTPYSVKKYILEEAYELSEAIDEQDPETVSEELGDLFFMLLFVAHMYEENEMFSLKQALDCIGRKMIRRHPHVFGDMQVANSEEVAANWLTIKGKEARDKGEVSSVLGHLPKSLPALQRAFRVGERASRVGFDWAAAEDIWGKIAEEEQELKEAMAENDREAMAQEIGDLLFTISNLSRLLEINPENALRDAVNKFMARFYSMEELIRQSGKGMADSSLKEMDRAWSAVKENGSGT